MQTSDFNELGFDEIAKNVLAHNPSANNHENSGGQGDCAHINSMSVLGPATWYDAGDERFNPENIIWDARSNVLAIINQKTGRSLWQIGPDFPPETKSCASWARSSDSITAI